MEMRFWCFMMCLILDDRDKYLEAILERKEKEFKQKYADYDVILRKLELLKQAIVDLGFKIG